MKIEKMCKKCRIMVPPDVAILTDCAWEIERRPAVREELEQRVKSFSECLDKAQPVCRKCGCLTAYLGIPEGFDGETVLSALHIGTERAGETVDAVISYASPKPVLTLALSPCEKIRTALSPLPGADAPREITDFVFSGFGQLTQNFCLPCIVGVGLGTTPEKASQLALIASDVRYAGTENPSPEISAVESKLLRKLNRNRMGIANRDGQNSVLAVNIESEKSMENSKFCCVSVACYAIGRQKIEI